MLKDVLAYYSFIGGFPTLLVIIDLFYFINHDKRLLRSGKIALELMIMAVPFVLLLTFESIADYKLGEALFNPSYGWLMYTLIVLCQMAYFYSSYRRMPSSPVKEVLLNCLLLIGIVLNIMISIQLASLPGALVICLPATMLFIMMLIHNHRLFVYTLEDVDTDLLEPAPRGRFSRTCCFLLSLGKSINH